MTTIKEDYVSFETAKLLKEKGFDSDEVGCCGGFYSERCYEAGRGIKTKSGQEVGIVYDDLTNSELEHDEYLRPTQSMAMKWLREVHDIHIVTVFLGHSLKWTPTIWKIDMVIPESKHVKSTFNTWETYEEACEAAIKYCLENLI